MKALCTAMLILVATTSLLAQPELASTCFNTPRKVLNQVKTVGDWTWFTLDGALYRKHVDIDTAELWYKATVGENYYHGYRGMLHELSKLAHHAVFSSRTTGLPHGTQLVRIDPEGNVWFSDCRGTTAAFDGIQWRFTVDRAANYSETWAATPFAPDSAFPQAALAFRPSLDLLRSIREEAPEVPRRGVSPRIGVSMFDIHQNGNLFVATTEGVHVFRPLAENETKLGAPSSAAAPYPNPANSTATFALNDNNVNKMTIDIRDLTGRLRLQNIEGASSGTVVDVTGLEEGVYVALLKSGGKSATTTFTVKR